MRLVGEKKTLVLKTGRGGEGTVGDGRTSSSNSVSSTHILSVRQRVLTYHTCCEGKGWSGGTRSEG